MTTSILLINIKCRALSFLGTGNIAVNRNKTPDLMVLHSNWGDRWNIPEGSKYNGEKESKKGVGCERMNGAI